MISTVKAIVYILFKVEETNVLSIIYPQYAMPHAIYEWASFW